MTQKQTNRHSHNGVTATQATANPERLRAVPASDPEAVPKAQRRIFTASYKLWVLEEGGYGRTPQLWRERRRAGYGRVFVYWGGATAVHSK